MHKPERTCISCRKKGNKEDFFRIVCTKDGSLFFDPTGKACGRGAYVCRDSSCIQNLRKKKGLERAYKRAVPEEVYESVLKEIV